MKSLYESIIKNTRIGKYAKELHDFYIDDIVYSDGKQLKFFIITDIDDKKDIIIIQQIGREWTHNNYYIPDMKKKDVEQVKLVFDKKSGYFWLNNSAVIRKYENKPLWSII